jgi:hypothetical protein
MASLINSAVEKWTDDELLAAGAALEDESLRIASEIETASLAASAEQRSIRKSTIKLGINTVIAAGGIVAAPLTFGISLIFTLGGFAMLLWDGIDHARDRGRFRTTALNMRQLRYQAEAIEADLAAIAAELERRTAL